MIKPGKHNDDGLPVELDWKDTDHNDDGLPVLTEPKKKVGSLMSGILSGLSQLNGGGLKSNGEEDKKKVLDYMQGLKTPEEKKISELRPITNRPIKKNETPFDQTQEEAIGEGVNKINEIMYGEGEDWKDPIKAIDKGLKESNDVKSALKHTAAKDITINSLAPDGFEANRILNDSIWGKMGDDNLTTRMLADKVVKYNETVGGLRSINPNTVMGQNDISAYIRNSAIKSYANENPTFKDDLIKGGYDLDDPDLEVKLPPEKVGQIFAEYINKPDVHAYLKKENPALIPSFNVAVNNIYRDNPDYGVNVIANEVSKERTKRGYNEAIVNYYGKEDKDATNKIAEELYKDEPDKLALYNSRIRDHQEYYIDAPSLLANTASGIKGVFNSMATLVKQPFTSNKEIIYNKLEKEASNVSADPKGFLNFTSSTGNVLGFLMAVGATGGATGLSSINALTLATTGDIIQEAREKYTDSPIKATLSAGLNMVLYRAMGKNIFPVAKVGAAFSQAKPEINKIVEKLANGSITNEAARIESQSLIKNGVDLVAGVAKSDIKISLELTGIAAVNQLFDKVSMNDAEYNKHHPEGELLKNFEHNLLSNAVIGGLTKYGEMKNANKVVSQSLYEAASNPKLYEREINNASVSLTYADVQEMKSNLKFIAGVKQRLDAEGVSSKNQPRALFEALQEKVKNESITEIGNKVLDKKKSDEIKEHQEIQQKILAGEDADTIVTEREQKIIDEKEENAIKLQRLQEDNDIDNKKFDADKKVLIGKIDDIDGRVEGMEGKNKLKAQLEDLELKRKRANEDFEKESAKLTPPEEKPAEPDEALPSTPQVKSDGGVDKASNVGGDEKIKLPKGAKEVFHYSENESLNKLEDRAGGTWFTDNGYGYQRRPGVKGKLSKVIEPDNLNLATEKQVWAAGDGNWANGVKKIKEQGFDGIKQTVDGDKHYLVFDLKNVKDKSDYAQVNESLSKQESGASNVGGDVDAKLEKIKESVENYQKAKADGSNPKLVQAIEKEMGIENSVYVARKEIKVGEDKFVLSQINENNNTNTFLIEDANGNEIGKAQLSADGNYLENIRVDEKYRRKGLASKLYDFIESRKGIELQPSPNKQSTEAKALWEKRNLSKSISKKANAGVLANSLGGAIKQTIKDAGNKLIEDLEKRREKELEEESQFMQGKEKSQIENSKRIINEKYDKEIAKVNENIDRLIKSPATEQSLSKQESGASDVVEGKDVVQPDQQKIIENETPDTKGSNEGAEPVKPKEESQPPEPPIEGGKTAEGEEEGNLSGITHEATDETRKEFGLGEPYEKKPTTEAELTAKAEEAIKAGYNIENLLGQLEAGVPPTAVETFILKKYKAGLEAKIIKDPSDANLADLRRLVKASDAAGSGQGLGLWARKGMDLRDDSLAGFFTTEQDVNLDAPLTETQKATVQKEWESINNAKAKFEEYMAKKEEEFAAKQAEAELSKAKKSTPRTKKTHEDHVEYRKKVVEDIREKLKKARSETSATIVPYAKELFAIAPDVAKLVKDLLEEGVTKLGDIVDNIHDTLKDSFPALQKKDVHDIIAGEYNEPKLTKNEIAKQLYELRQQAQLVNKYEKLESGEEPKAERKKVQRNQELEALRKQIKEHDLTKLAEYKAKTKEQITKLEQDLPKATNPPPKLLLKLDQEGKDLQVKLINAKRDREIRLLKQEYQNRSKSKKAQDWIIDKLNVPRTIMASMDYSAPLRQGIVAAVAHPRTAALAQMAAFKASFSPKFFDRWFYEVKETPRWDVAHDSGLALTDPHSPFLTAKEEAFMNNTAEKIPIAGELIKGSERAYVMFLNKMRWDLFNRFADRLEEKGKTIENSPKEYKKLAEYINNQTGRGGLNKSIEPFAPMLNTMFFAPRLIASRLNLLNPLYYAKLPKELRVMAAKDMLKFIGLGMSVLALAKLNGNQVDDDPRSSDFGKIKSGNTRWDIWGGFQQYVRAATQLVTGQRKSTNTGNISTLNGQGAFGTNRGDVLLSFIRGKLAPVPSMAADAISGRTASGEKTTWGGEAESHLLPLLYSDIKSAVEDRGVRSLFDVGVPAIFGVGTQTYTPKKQSQGNTITQPRMKQPGKTSLKSMER